MELILVHVSSDNVVVLISKKLDFRAYVIMHLNLILDAQIAALALRSLVEFSEMRSG